MSEVKLWICPECGFGFDEIHEDVEGGHSCPECELSEKGAEIERLQDNLNRAIEALENISNMGYDAYQGHTHMLYDAQMHAHKTLQSIKGGETDATQTSS